MRSLGSLDNLYLMQENAMRSSTIVAWFFGHFTIQMFERENNKVIISWVYTLLVGSIWMYS